MEMNAHEKRNILKFREFGNNKMKAILSKA